MTIGNLKFEAYFELLYPLLVADSLRTLKDAPLFVPGYHWLPPATIDLVGDIREFEILGIFCIVKQITG